RLLRALADEHSRLCVAVRGVGVPPRRSPSLAGHQGAARAVPAGAVLPPQARRQRADPVLATPASAEDPWPVQVARAQGRAALQPGVRARATPARTPTAPRRLLRQGGRASARAARPRDAARDPRPRDDGGPLLHRL